MTTEAPGPRMRSAPPPARSGARVAPDLAVDEQGGGRLREGPGDPDRAASYRGRVSKHADPPQLGAGARSDHQRAAAAAGAVDQHQILGAEPDPRRVRADVEDRPEPLPVELDVARSRAAQQHRGVDRRQRRLQRDRRRQRHQVEDDPVRPRARRAAVIGRVVVGGDDRLAQRAGAVVEIDIQLGRDRNRRRHERRGGREQQGETTGQSAAHGHRDLLQRGWRSPSPRLDIGEWIAAQCGFAGFTSGDFTQTGTGGLRSAHDNRRNTLSACRSRAAWRALGSSARLRQGRSRFRGERPRSPGPPETRPRSSPDTSSGGCSAVDRSGSRSGADVQGRIALRAGAVVRGLPRYRL